MIKLLSCFAISFNLRRYNLAGCEMITFSKLAIEAFIFADSSEVGGEQYVRASIVGEVASISAVPGRSFGASVSLDTKEDLVVLDVHVTHESPMFRLFVSARVPLSGNDPIGWRPYGNMTVNLGDTGAMALEVNGTKLYDPETSKRHGYQWHVVFALTEFELNLGGSSLELTDVAGDFTGKTIGDAPDKVFIIFLLVVGPDG